MYQHWLDESFVLRATLLNVDDSKSIAATHVYVSIVK